MQARRAVEVGATQLAIKVAAGVDLTARDTKNRVIEGIVERLLNLTSHVLGINVGRECFLDDPSRFELVPDIHDWIVKAIAERNTDKAIRELEHHHFDIQMDQINNQNDENHHHHHDKPNRIAEDKGGDERNLH